MVLDTNTYTQEHIEIRWEIEKAPIDMALVSWNKTEFTYSGEHQAPIIENLPKEITLSEYSLEEILFSGNQAVSQSIEAGSYIITATISYDTDNYVLVNNSLQPCGFIIHKAVIDVSAVEWESVDNFVYDLEEHKPVLMNLPELISATYTYYNMQGVEVSTVNAGAYYVVATLIFDEKNYNLSEELVLEKEFSVRKATIDTSLLVWPTTYLYEWREEGYTFSFDESITKDMIEITYTYYTNAYYEPNEVVEKPTAIGRYKVVATFNYDSENYAFSTNVVDEFEFVIEGRQIDTSSIKWIIPETPLVYNGEEQFLYVSGVPEGIEATYYGATDAGERSFGVGLSGENYQSIYMSTKYTIEKATIDLTQFVLTQTEYEYSGSQYYIPESNIIHPYGDVVRLDCITGYYETQVGEYQMVVDIDLRDDDNYNPIGVYYLYFDWEIVPRTIIHEDVHWVGDEVISYTKSLPIPFLTNVYTYIDVIYTYYKFNDSTSEYESITRSGISRAGKYKVEAQYDPYDLANYNLIENDYPKFFEFEVVTSDYNFSKIMMNSTTYRYADGKYAIQEEDRDVQFKYYNMSSYRGLMLAYENFAPNDYHPYGDYTAIPLSLDSTVLYINGENIDCVISGDDPNGGVHGGEYTTTITLKLGEGHTEGKYNKVTKVYEISWVKLKRFKVEDAGVAGTKYNEKEFMRLKNLYLGESLMNSSSGHYIGFAINFEYRSNSKTTVKLYSDNGKTVSPEYCPANNSTHLDTYLRLNLYTYHEKIEINYNEAGYTHTQIINIICLPMLTVNGEEVMINGFPESDVRIYTSQTDKLTLTFDVSDKKYGTSPNFTAGEIFDKYKIYYSDSEYDYDDENLIEASNPTVTVEDNNLYLHIWNADYENGSGRKYVVSIILINPDAPIGGTDY